MEENRLALIGIVVENKESVKKLNEILSSYSDYIIGRMGLPRKEEGVNLISVYVEAAPSIINTISGKIGMLNGVTSKVLMAKISN